MHFVLRPSIPDSSLAAVAVALAASLCGGAEASAVCAVNRGDADFGVFDKPFAADSPWNSRPVSPVFGTDTIPASTYFPSIGQGAYSTQAFEAQASDPPVTIQGTGANGVWDPDAEAWRTSITLPHWPAGVTPAGGSDGHAEVVDITTGIVHSFYRLQQVGGVWQAQQYAWTALGGRGFGDPAHYMQGARSSGTSTLGGLMRTSEIDDGDTMYRHALAMSMTFNGLSPSPAYVFPATSADTNARTTNTGTFPLGSLMMLPPGFDTSTIANLQLRKVAETLKTYGAYVVDRNTGTPYAIYAENGSTFSLMPHGWDNQVASDEVRIQQALRRVVSAAGWVDGAGQAFGAYAQDQNIVSLRGYWWRSLGSTSGTYDTWRQAMVFPATDGPIQENNSGGRAYSGVAWAAPAQGARYHLVAITSGAATFRMTLKDRNTGATVYDSGVLNNGQSSDFAWPAADFVLSTFVANATSGAAGTVAASLTPTTAVGESACDGS